MSGYAGPAGHGAGGATGESDLVQPTRLHELAYEFVRRSPNVGRTKLAKLLYMADLEHFCRRGVTLTGAAYVRQWRGPIPVALYQIERDLDKWAWQTETKEVGPGYNEVRHKAIEGALSPTFDAPEAEVIDLISSTYGRMSLNDLKRVVYDTQPMQSILAIERETGTSLVGKPIDLSTCWPLEEEGEMDSSAIAGDVVHGIATEHAGSEVERETERLETAAALASAGRPT